VWDLNHKDETVKSFKDKAAATKGGALEKAVGEEGAPSASTSRRGQFRKSARSNAHAIRRARRAVPPAVPLVTGAVTGNSLDPNFGGNPRWKPRSRAREWVFL
jgi:hypothetical protein